MEHKLCEAAARNDLEMLTTYAQCVTSSAPQPACRHCAHGAALVGMLPGGIRTLSSRAVFTSLGAASSHSPFVSMFSHSPGGREGGNCTTRSVLLCLLPAAGSAARSLIRTKDDGAGALTKKELRAKAETRMKSVAGLRHARPRL